MHLCDYELGDRALQRARRCLGDAKGMEPIGGRAVQQAGIAKREDNYVGAGGGDGPVRVLPEHRPAACTQVGDQLAILLLLASDSRQHIRVPAHSDFSGDEGVFCAGLDARGGGSRGRGGGRAATAASTGGGRNGRVVKALNQHDVGALANTREEPGRDGGGGGRIVQVASPASVREQAVAA